MASTIKIVKETPLLTLRPNFHYQIIPTTKFLNNLMLEYVSNNKIKWIIESAVKPSFSRLNIRDNSLLNMLANQRINIR
jgi:hypothetical protein